MHTAHTCTQHTHAHKQDMHTVMHTRAHVHTPYTIKHMHTALHTCTPHTAHTRTQARHAHSNAHTCTCAHPVHTVTHVHTSFALGPCARRGALPAPCHVSAHVHSQPLSEEFGVAGTRCRVWPLLLPNFVPWSGGVFFPQPRFSHLWGGAQGTAPGAGLRAEGTHGSLRAPQGLAGSGRLPELLLCPPRPLSLLLCRGPSLRSMCLPSARC